MWPYYLCSVACNGGQVGGNVEGRCVKVRGQRCECVCGEQMEVLDVQY